MPLIYLAFSFIDGKWSEKMIGNSDEDCPKSDRRSDHIMIRTYGKKWSVIRSKSDLPITILILPIKIVNTMKVCNVICNILHEMFNSLIEISQHICCRHSDSRNKKLLQFERQIPDVEKKFLGIQTYIGFWSHTEKIEIIWVEI